MLCVIFGTGTMIRIRTLATGVLLLVAGYSTGVLTTANSVTLQAQEGDDQPFGTDILRAYRLVNKSVRELNSLLLAGGQITTVTTGINFFGVSVGGVNAEQDLEEGRGVDPETFAALYADMATPKIAEHLDYDEQGRLRYKKNVIRIYSKERLRTLFNQKDQLDVRSETAN